MKFLSNAAWQVITDELASKRHALQRADERIDRLMEALAAKQNIPLIMPQAELPIFTNRAPQPLETSDGWFDNRALTIPTPDRR